MTGHRILIVDDQRESTRLLRSSLDSLKQDFTINDVLSGEEAILELGRDQIDLLIADVRLPGISGLELMGKFKKQNPELKVVLISGVTDPKIRQQVAQAGADAFFFKPIDIADFLDSIERILGLVDTILPPELIVEQEEAIDREKEVSGMTIRITGLRDELNASSVCLIGDQGRVLVRIGDLPAPEIETSLMPTLMSAFTAGVRISHFLGQRAPDYLLNFRGENYDLFLSPVGEAYCLLVTTKPTLIKEAGKITKALQTTSKAVMMSLFNLGVSTQSRDSKPVTAPQPEAAEKDPTASDPDLEAVLVDGEKVKSKDADAFWESMAAEEIITTIESGDSLSYDQAMQLGLAPSEE